MNQGTAGSQAQYLMAAVPGTFNVVADVVFANDAGMFGANNLNASTDVLWHPNHQSSIVRVRFQAFAVPVLRQADGKTAVLNIGIYIPATVLDADAAILGFRHQSASALL